MKGTWSNVWFGRWAIANSANTPCMLRKNYHQFSKYEYILIVKPATPHAIPLQMGCSLRLQAELLLQDCPPHLRWRRSPNCFASLQKTGPRCGRYTQVGTQLTVMQRSRMYRRGTAQALASANNGASKSKPTGALRGLHGMAVFRRSIRKLSIHTVRVLNLVHSIFCHLTY